MPGAEAAGASCPWGSWDPKSGAEDNRNVLSHSPGGRNPKERCQQGHATSEGSAQELSQAPVPASGGAGDPGVPWLTAATLYLCLCPHAATSELSLLIRACH